MYDPDRCQVVLTCGYGEPYLRSWCCEECPVKQDPQNFVAKIFPPEIVCAYCGSIWQRHPRWYPDRPYLYYLVISRVSFLESTDEDLR